jgi:hypothetical protein
VIIRESVIATAGEQFNNIFSFTGCLMLSFSAFIPFLGNKRLSNQEFQISGDQKSRKSGFEQIIYVCAKSVKKFELDVSKCLT